MPSAAPRPRIRPSRLLAAAAVPAVALGLAAGANGEDIGPTPGPPDPGVIPGTKYLAQPIVHTRRTFVSGRYLKVRLSCPIRSGGCRATVRLRIIGSGLDYKLPTLRKTMKANSAPAYRIPLTASIRRQIFAARPAAGVRSIVHATSPASKKTFNGRYVNRLIRGTR